MARPAVHRISSRPLAAALVLTLSSLAGCGGGSETPAPSSFTVGGSVAGLEPGNPVTLQDNGGDALALNADGTFIFAAPVAGAYAVTVGRQPSWQDCVIANAAGTATADVANVDVRCGPMAAVVHTVAGNGTAGSADGNGTAATFNSPRGMAVDAAGNVYIPEWTGARLRKLTPAGDVSTVATGLGTLFNVAIGPDDNLYAASTDSHLIYRITPAGSVTTFAGSGAAATVDGNGTAASFNFPTGLGFDRAGNLYVAEYWGHVVRKITPAGEVTTFAGSGVAGAADGAGTAAGFNHPNGVAVAGDGTVYVADSSNAKIRSITPAGVVGTLAGTGTTGSADGPAATATFMNPYGITVGPEGAVYVADASANKVRRISRAGAVTTIAGTGTAGSADGAATSVATLKTPAGVVFDAAGNLCVAEAGNHTIRRVGRQP